LLASQDLGKHLSQWDSISNKPNTWGYADHHSKASRVQRKVMSIRRFLKRIVEAEVFNPIVDQAGYMPEGVSLINPA